MQLPAPVIMPYSNRKFEVAEDYVLTFGRTTVRIARGFLFDGATIPRLFWRVVGHPLQGLALPAALVHDALYRAQRVDRATADELFYGLLLANGVGRPKAWLLHRAVRLGGGPAWARATEASREVARRFVAVERPEPLGAAQLGRAALLALAGVLLLVGCAQLQVTLNTGENALASPSFSAPKEVAVTPSTSVAGPGSRATVAAPAVSERGQVAPGALPGAATPATP